MCEFLVELNFPPLSPQHRRFEVLHFRGEIAVPLFLCQVPESLGALNPLRVHRDIGGKTHAQVLHHLGSVGEVGELVWVVYQDLRCNIYIYNVYS